MAGAWALPTWDAEDLVRIDDPSDPRAVAVSASGALIVGPPDDGTPWRRASFPETDEVPVEALVDPFPAVEALEVLGVPGWHDEGLQGQGIKVAVFDSAWFVGESDPAEVLPISTHDCFASPTCELGFDIQRPYLTRESGAHGWACAEVVRDIVPEADIYLVRVNSLLAFENATEWAIREGIDVISMSLSYFNDSFYDGTGPQAALVERLDRAGILLVTSAGNTAEQHWSGVFRDANGDRRLDGDGDDGLWTYLDQGSATIYLNWDERDRCGTTDLSLQLVDDRRYVLGRSDDLQDPEDEDCEPYERVRASVTRADWYRIEVVRERGSSSTLAVDVLSRDGTMFEPVFEHSVTDPATHPRALAVAAVPAYDYAAGTVEDFSAWGPNHAGWLRPDLAGPDGLTTDTYGPVGFYGTSASAPAVAGLVALVMSSEPGLGGAEAADRLRGWARTDHPDGGFDPRWGAGKARLPRRDPGPVACGRRPLMMFVLPMLWVGGWRRLRQVHAASEAHRC